MSIDIRVTGASALVDELRRVASNIEPAIERGLDVVATRALQAKQRTAAETYGRSIPRSGTGRPKWDRSGDFQSEITIESEPGQRTIVNRGSSEKYEAVLAQLPVSADGVNRQNDAAAKAQANVEPQIQAIMEQEIINALGL